MPELPEVETIRRGLTNPLQDRTIIDVQVRAPKIFEGNPEDLIGKTIRAVTRHGKLLLFVLDGDNVLTIHLKMTGQLIWKPQTAPIIDELERLEVVDNAEVDFEDHDLDEAPEMVVGGHPEKAYMQALPHKHTHVVFSLDDGSTLYFNDLRKFGRVSIISKEALPEHAFLQKLGPEPLTPDFTVDYLIAKLLARPKQPVKAFLLDQTNIAGLGNIYADESLFRAAIRPDRFTGAIKPGEVRNLHEAIQETLELAIMYGGSSEKDYVNAIGDKGTYLRIANVYHRTGEECNRCKIGVIERIKIASRSTHFCPVCQK